MELTEDSKAKFLVASKNLDTLLFKEEIYWAQRSRIPWLKHGDKNTRFFHLKASQRKQRNHIQSIKNAEDVWVEDESDIAGVALEYFETLFKAGTCERLEECLNGQFKDHSRHATSAIQYVLCRGGQNSVIPNGTNKGTWT